MKFGCSIGLFLSSAHLICRSTDISKYFRGSLRLRDNESRLYKINFSHHQRSCDLKHFFLTYVAAFGLFLALLENSALPMGWDSSHATLKVTPEI